MERMERMVPESEVKAGVVVEQPPEGLGWKAPLSLLQHRPPSLEFAVEETVVEGVQQGRTWHPRHPQAEMRGVMRVAVMRVARVGAAVEVVALVAGVLFHLQHRPAA